MFEGLKRFWKGFMRMFGYTTLKQIVGKDITLSDNMINAINQWKQMLNGQADWITDSIVSLGIEEGICREFADCVLVEMETNLSNERLKEYSPEMRDEAFKRGLEEYKREIEFSVVVAYGDLSDVQEVAKTATEIKVSKNRKYNRVTAIQNNLYDCLEDFAAGLAFYNSMLNSGYEFSCKFNDSILTDEETERKQDMADVAAGFMHHWEYRMKWYGEDEETAKANVPEQNQVME